ncbi:MAG: transglutaminase domain-containing protein [Lachnotalea sp.]
MKKLSRIIIVSFAILALLSGYIYLREETPDLYWQINEVIGETIHKNQTNESNQSNQVASTDTNVVKDEEVSADSSEDTTNKEDANTQTESKDTLDTQLDTNKNVPITDENKGTISQEELAASQRTGMVPIEGTGQEVDQNNVVTDAGDLGENYTFDATMYPYRAMLNSKQQAVYNQIYANAVNYNGDVFALQTTISAFEMDDVMTAIYNDHPELFWLETQYQFQYGPNNMVYTVQLEFNETMDDIEGNLAKYNEKINQIVQLSSQYDTDVEKEKCVHDYLQDTITYDESAPMNQSAYSALVGGKSVCAGYSRAFQNVMMKLDIPTYYCSGIADGGGHAWNIIKLGDDHYNSDTLWDDSIGEDYNTYCYLYFNITDADFSEEHRRTGLSVNLPACNGTEMSYESAFGDSAVGEILSSYGLSEADVITSLEDYYNYCETALTQAGLGESSFTVVLMDQSLYDEILQDVNNKGYIDGYMRTVAQNLGLGNCNMSIQLSGTELPDSYVVLTQNTNISVN